MIKAQLKLVTPQGYQALTTETLAAYLGGIKSVAQRLGGQAAQWDIREVGDGNLNLVFIVKGPDGAVAVKQALPYVRLVGESWPLPLSRAHFEYAALVEEAAWAKDFAPEIYYHDALMALTVMEYLSPHIILRKGLIAGVTYPKMAADLGAFLALTLYHTSDLHLNAVEKKEKIAAYLTNTAMCKISEDLIFDEPYFDAPMNRHTAPQLDDVAAAFKKDVALKAAAQAMKWRFQNTPEALLHGDFHTGSVMATADDTRVIDPEFAFYGPMGFDVGAILANLFMAHFSQEGHGSREDFAAWILAQTEVLWDVFAAKFSALWRERDTARQGGDIYQPRLYSVGFLDEVIAQRLRGVWADALGFAGCKIIRRILGLAHVEDFEAIENMDVRAQCERRALNFARQLLVERQKFQTIKDVMKAAKNS